MPENRRGQPVAPVIAHGRAVCCYASVATIVASESDSIQAGSARQRESAISAL